MLRLLSVLFVFLLASCSTMRTSHKIDAAYDFGKAKSFTWDSQPIHSTVQNLDPKLYQLVKKNIKEIVSNSLSARGYAEKLSGGDLKVKVDLSTYSNATVDRIKMEDDYDNDQDSQEIKRAMLKVTVKDSATKTTIYESEVSDIMTKKKNRMNKFRELIFRMMEKMPKK
ncbi:MAG: DUF4136 domain-containing protein [Lentisphaeraceae bacterium]|nr:DUF4136 domain-containing protein [Lentisphaeraceae bacterium]